MAHTVLIVDDDPTQRRLMEGVISRLGYKTVAAENGGQAVDLLQSGEGQNISMMMLDLVMPELDGFEVLEQIRPFKPDLPVIVLTAQGGIDTVVKAMRAGAVDFFVKPTSPERIKIGIENALKLRALTGEIRRLNKKHKGEMTFADLIADSAAMRQVIRLGERAAKSNIPILIEGESGVGKELIARAIQGQSDRAGRPFVTVNCGAIPENLFESILFGHEKGSFTGASEKHAGKFQEANGGTLFLDEIGELPLDMQVKLLRALQEGEVDPVGAKRPVKVDVRLISATNKDLLTLAQSGDFREDLYYRLNVFPIHVPPLRDRAEDVPLLAEHFVQRFAAEESKQVVGINAEAAELLKSFQWPGNVRQLENTVFRAVVLADRDRLGFNDFPQISSAIGLTEPKSEWADNDTGFPGEDGNLLEQPSQNASDYIGTAEVAAPDQAANANSAVSETSTYSSELDDQSARAIAAVDPSGHLRTLEAIESDMIRLAIETYSGHMSEVARRLGIGRSTLYRKVRELGLDKQASG